MSELPFAPIFSAAHVSKWGASPEAVLSHDTQYRLELERKTRLSVDCQCDAECTTSKSSSAVCKMITVRVATTNPAVGAESHMAIKTHTFITLWFLLTAPVILWDATYCLTRPRSMVGGDLHWIWEPYTIYQEVDYMYGLKALQENNGFTNAQSLLNLVETTLNLVYVYLAHVSSWSGAPLVGFTAATMTLSKTILYFMQEYSCGGCSVGHNPWGTLLLYYLFPNGLWVIFPSLIMWRLGGDIMSALSIASQSARRITSGKTQ